MKWGDRATEIQTNIRAKLRADLKLLADELDGKADSEFDANAFRARMQALAGQNRGLIAAWCVVAIALWELAFFAVPLLWRMI